MSVSTVQAPPTDLQRFLRATQQKRDATRESQGAPAIGTAPLATSDATRPPPTIGKEAAKLVADLKVLLIGQQSDADGTATSATPQVSAGTAATTPSLPGVAPPANDAGRTGAHHHAPLPTDSAASAPTASASTPGTSGSSSTDTAAPLLVKALQAYAKSGQATASAASVLAA